METVNAHRSINHTLAVIDGGLQTKAESSLLRTAPKPKLLDQVRQTIETPRGAHKRGSYTGPPIYRRYSPG